MNKFTSTTIIGFNEYISVGTFCGTVVGTKFGYWSCLKLTLAWYYVYQNVEFRWHKLKTIIGQNVLTLAVEIFFNIMCKNNLMVCNRLYYRKIRVNYRWYNYMVV